MQRETLFEKNKLINRFKEITTLIIFIVIIAVISIILMDILIHPLTVFAIDHKNEFNYIITDVSIFLILLTLILLFLKKIFRLKKDGYKSGEIIKYLALRPVQILLIFFLIIFSSSIVIYLLYLLFKYNSNIFRYLQI